MIHARQLLAAIRYLALPVAVLILISLAIPSNAAPVGQLDSDIILRIMSPQDGERVEGNLVITGFAGDRRSRQGSGINEQDIQLYLDAPASGFDDRSLLAVPGTWRRNELSEQEPSCCSPELAAALIFRNPWNTCSFPTGRHTLTAWASSLVVPGARQRADIAIDLIPCPPDQVLVQHDLAATQFRSRYSAPQKLDSGIS